MLSESDFIGFKVARDVAKAKSKAPTIRWTSPRPHVDSAQDSLDKTTITAPMDGTITTLNSQLGERVLGTVQNAGTEIMTISDLSQMEARVDIGEMDVVLLQAGQKAKLEVDSFKDRKFNGVVTAVGQFVGRIEASSVGSGQQQFIVVQARRRRNSRCASASTTMEQFRPGMSVSAEIETRSRTNVLAVPIASVTTRIIKQKVETDPPKTNSVANQCHRLRQQRNKFHQRPDKKSDDKKSRWTWFLSSKATM